MTGHFLATDHGILRARKEQALLDQFFPGFEIDIDNEGAPYANGWLGPSELMRGRYRVYIQIPPTYGRGTMPNVYIVDPDIREGAPHLFNDKPIARPFQPNQGLHVVLHSTKHHLCT